MPIYAYRCDCGHAGDYVSSVERRGELPDHCGQPVKKIISRSYVIDDTKPYQSPIDLTWITTKAAHRDHMKRHGVIEVGNEKLTRPATKQYEPTGIKKDIYEAMHR